MINIYTNCGDPYIIVDNMERIRRNSGSVCRLFYFLKSKVDYMSSIIDVRVTSEVRIDSLISSTWFAHSERCAVSLAHLHQGRLRCIWHLNPGVYLKLNCSILGIRDF